jgi:hypothetical protein
VTDPVAAPALREVAEIWWDVEADPVVRWRDDGTTFVLTDPAGAHELHLATFASPVDDPAGMAAVLAEGLAACDFPPTGDGAARGRVTATLRAAGRTEPVVTVT